MRFGAAAFALATLRAKAGGAEGARTPDPHNAIVVLYQLSYDPIQSGQFRALLQIVKMILPGPTDSGNCLINFSSFAERVFRTCDTPVRRTPLPSPILL